MSLCAHGLEEIGSVYRCRKCMAWFPSRGDVILHSCAAYDRDYFGVR